MSISTAMAIMMGVFFIVPFVMRGARMSLERMKNDVKDWLPASFQETRDLDWFRAHFLGEQFVVCTWKECKGTKDDTKFKLFLDKLFPEVPPSMRDKVAKPDESKWYDPDLDLYIRQMSVDDTKWREKFIGDRLGLYVQNVAKGQDPYHTNWGGLDEKWLKGYGGAWYFIRPISDPNAAHAEPGDALHPAQPHKQRYALYRWDGTNSLLGGVYRSAAQKFFGVSAASGEYLTTFHEKDGAWYYENPQRLSGQWFKTITTGPATLSRLVNPPDGQLSIPESEARRRLHGMLFGKVLEPAVTEGESPHPEVRQTCMILTLTDAAKRDLHQAVGRGILGKPLGQLQRAAAETGDLDLHLGGPPVDNVAIDEEGQITLVQLIGYSALVGIGLSYILLRSFLQTLMVFFVGSIGAVMSLAIVYWSGASVDAVLLTMPSLVYVLGIAGTLHMVNNYMLTARERGHRGSPEIAAAHSFPPQLFCEITTALGLWSLCTSDIVPIYKFGLYSGIATMAMLLVLFAYLPAALEVWPTAKRRLQPGEAPDPNEADIEVEVEEDDKGFLHQIQERIEYVLDAVPHTICAFLLRNYTAAAVICTLVSFGLGWGIVYLRTEVNLLKMFDSSTDIIKDYTWLEDNLGKLVPMEIVIRVAPEAIYQEAKEGEGEEKKPVKPLVAAADQKFQFDFLERMEAAAMIRGMLEEEFGEQGRDIVGAVTSVDTFVPPIPGPKQVNIRGPMSRRLEAHREELVHTDYLRENHDPKDKGAELWRISLRLAALKNVDYGQFVGALESGIEPALKAYPKRMEILKVIDQANAGEGFTKANVLILGANFDLYDKLARSRKARTDVASQAEAKGEASDDEEAAKQKAEEAKLQKLDQSYASRPLSQEDQTRIFSMQLRHLLQAARCIVAWHDPTTAPPVRKPRDASTVATPKDGELWIERLKKQKCVVLVGDAEGYDLKQIKEICPIVIDCRDHRFLAGLDATTARDAKEPVHAIYTGLVPVVYKAQRTLLESLNESFIWSLITITPTMMFILIPGRNIWEKFYPTNIYYGFMGGVVAMLPNTFPIAIVFGVMGYLGVVIDIGTMMTASVAVGIAVDDTIHFLTYFRDGLNEGKTKEEAILEGYKKCAVSFIQTALICGLGLGVFAFSTFTPTQRFGIMMLWLLNVAVFGDLLFLPALLAGPLGWFFRPNPLHEDEDRELREKKHAAEELEKSKGLQTEAFAPTTKSPADPREEIAADQAEAADDAPSDDDSAGGNGDSKGGSTRHSDLRKSGSRALRHDKPHPGTP